MTVAEDVTLPFAPGSMASLALARTVSRVLSEDECGRLISLTEKVGYEPALVNIGMGRQVQVNDLRKLGRCITDSCELADEL